MAEQPSLDPELDAWYTAEYQVWSKLKEILGAEDGDQLFVGDSNDLAGRIEMMVFQVEGGGEQDHCYNDGADDYKTVGILRGIFSRRGNAMRIMSRLMRRKNMPFRGDDANMKNVVKVYLRTHPIIRKVWHELANQNMPVQAYLVEITFGVVYRVVTP